MSKKNKRKNYSKQQFLQIVCNQCKYCYSQAGSTPKPALFCFEFKHRLFIRHALPRLKNITTEKLLLDFDTIFCKICDFKDNKFGACDELDHCMFLFKDQSGDIVIKSKDLRIKSFREAAEQIATKLKKSNKEKPVIKVAYPSIFHNKNTEWETCIKEIIENTA